MSDENSTHKCCNFPYLLSADASRTIATLSYQQPKDTSLWICVEEYSEGMATWRKSFAEILMVAKKLNATVVEPCIRLGYLRACDDYTARLNQVYDVSQLRKFYPNMVSYEDYQAMVAAEDPVIVPMCFHRTC